MGNPRLLELLRQLAFQERDVLLSSGQRSNFYIDCKQVTLSAEGSFLVGQALFAAICEKAPHALGVGGLTLGADPLATATSLISFIAGRPLAAFIVRKEPKSHGTSQWVESSRQLPPGSPVVVVEDVITTGASALRAIERAEQAELQVVHVMALVDRLEGGSDAITKVPVTSLFTRKDFLP